MKEKLILIGNGMAGMRAVEELLAIDPNKYDITVFGEEPHGNYNRIMLSPVLGGEKTIEEIMINDLDWYKENNVELIAGQKVVSIDREAKTVTSEDGVTRAYDKIILGTGSSPFILPLPGKNLEGVITFRDIHDVNTMIETAKTHKHAVVIGGGLLGLEAANGLLKHGMDVTVVHNLDTLMNRQLDEPSAELLRKALEERKLKFEMSRLTEELISDENGRVCKIRFQGGDEIPADLVVMAVGIRPNTELAAKSELDTERGVIVSDAMQTSDESIFAVGECVQHRGEIFGLVAPLWEQAKVLAKQLCGDTQAAYTGSVTSTKLKVTGIDVFSAGDFIDGDDKESIVFQDPNRGIYKKVVLKDGKLIGSVLYGDVKDGNWYFQLLKDETDVSEYRDTIVFGQAFVGGGQMDETEMVANMADDAEICGCNGVCKGTVVNAINENGLKSVDEVRAHTKASASCGSCTGLVEQVLKVTLGDEFEEGAKVKSVCACTDKTHEEVRDSIRDKHLTSIREVYDTLGWNTPDGCHICRPAVNYYLISTWPAEAEDDQQSRFTNERMHANIQKDNTYTVVPRMFGGMCTSDELRALADAADKYEVPMIKVTGGQRIDLVGVKKDDLTSVWKDLNEAGMVSGHAYGKSLRTVKTCIGKAFCRFGTQDSTQMGYDLEKLTWGSWTPAKVKMAVSGCPRNCAEATIKDFGVVAVDSGWELHVGGNGGLEVRACDFLTKVETEDEVMEYAAAFMQLYREQGRYNERTAPWIVRVGLDFIKANIVEDAENRKALADRFNASQKIYQKDPWKERASEGKRSNDFIPIKQVS
jgi:nitrite reductase (NADH) large subunit